MRATDDALGLRERKKIETRHAIRREAFRLTGEHGYAATTVEQIAEAAEVSPSTFFRYFPSKESVLLADDMDPVILDALAALPTELSPSQALRRAYEITMANISEDQREFDNTRQRLIFSIPELKAAMYDEYHRTVTTIAEAIGRRIDRDATDSSCGCSPAPSPARSWRPTIPVRARPTPSTEPWTSSTPECP